MEKGYYWVIREKGDTLQIAYINSHQMGIMLIDHDLQHMSEYHWIGERIKEPIIQELDKGKENG